METKRLEMKINLQNIMLAAARDCKNTGINMAFSISDSVLVKLAGLIIQSEDAEMIKLMQRIGYITAVE